MKNIFNKREKKSLKKFQALDKKQLEKVIGGAETTFSTGKPTMPIAGGVSGSTN